MDKRTKSSSAQQFGLFPSSSLENAAPTFWSLTADGCDDDDDDASVRAGIPGDEWRVTLDTDGNDDDASDAFVRKSAVY
jgi:hypothetical protein